MIVAKRTWLRGAAGPAYDNLHREIPEDLRAALGRAGVHQWRIWRDGEEVFHVIDVEDRDRMSQIMAEEPANERWQRVLHPVLAPPGPDRTARDLAEVWSLHR